jgi:hypothetical protein
MDNDIKTAVLKHLSYCRENNWAGIDPYDALNSRVFRALPFLNSRLPRIALTQLLKRSPVNIRALLRTESTQNPKALACFLSAFLKLEAIGVANEEDYAGLMIERLTALRSEGVPYWCWGYSFPWQTRKVLVPRGAPNLVCTYFVASSLLDAYERRRDARCLDMAVSAAEYVLNELYWIEDGRAGFAYPIPSSRQQVHNANLVAAALLCRVQRYTGDDRLLGPALHVARYAAAKQQANGSWDYGEYASQHWKDNFHTGYNLCALRSIGIYAETKEFEPYLRRGFDFFRTHFFLPDGAVKYYHDRTYPIDPHCIAQSIITLLELRDLDARNFHLARLLFRWAMDHLWDERGFFYYRVLRFFTIRTSYMRWTQAWMFLAIATLLAESDLLGRTGAGTSQAVPVEA